MQKKRGAKGAKGSEQQHLQRSTRKHAAAHARKHAQGHAPASAAAASRSLLDSWRCIGAACSTAAAVVGSALRPGGGGSHAR
jgi:hypothetical protein